MVHIFKIDDVYSCVDTNSGSIHIIDEITYKLLENDSFKSTSSLDKLYSEFGKESVDEAVSEINELIENKMLYTDSIELKKNMKTAV